MRLIIITTLSLLVGCVTKKEIPYTVKINGKKVTIDSCGYLGAPKNIEPYYEGVYINEIVEKLKLNKLSLVKFVKILGEPYTVDYTHLDNDILTFTCRDTLNNVIKCDYLDTSQINESSKQGYALTLCYQRGSCKDDSYEYRQDLQHLPEYIFQFKDGKLFRYREYVFMKYQKWHYCDSTSNTPQGSATKGYQYWTPTLN